MSPGPTKGLECRETLGTGCWVTGWVTRVLTSLRICHISRSMRVPETNLWALPCEMGSVVPGPCQEHSCIDKPQ